MLNQFFATGNPGHLPLRPYLAYEVVLLDAMPDECDDLMECEISPDLFDRIAFRAREMRTILPMGISLDYHVRSGPYLGMGDTDAIAIRVENRELCLASALVCRSACMMLSLCTRRRSVPRDIRIMLARLLWKTRKTGVWPIEVKPGGDKRSRV